MRSVFTPDVRRGFRALSDYLGTAKENKKRAWVLIPDQMALTVERELSLSLPANAQLYYDTVSFRRLSNNIFRRFGGLHYNYADKSAEALLLWRAMTFCRDADALLLYKDTLSDTSAVPVIMSAVNELKQSMISPEDFTSAAVRLYSEEKTSEAAKKFLDLSNIYAAYDEMLRESYDDRLADLSYAADILSKNDFFEGDELFVFSFSSFTAQQYRIIKEAAKQCSSVTVIFTCPSEFSLRGHTPEFDGIADTNKRLHSLADSVGVPYEIEILPTERDDDPANLSAALWGMPKKLSDTPPAHIKLVECNTQLSEAEFAAIEISKAIRRGLRYRDIAIVSGSPESYSGILDRILDEHSIPAHMSRPKELRSVPAVSATLSAIKTVTGGWRREDVISYCKTGYSPVTDDDADELLLYLSTWNISGKRFYDPEGGGWSMNPDGYTPDWTEEGERILSLVNEARVKLTERLMPLYEAMSDSTTAKEKTEAILNFLELTLSEAEKDSDPISVGADAETQAAEILRRAAGDIPLIFGDGKMKTADYVSALNLALDTLTVGTLPTLTDEVEVTDPLRMRGAGYELVIMLGVGDGVFPANANDTGFFSDDEKLLFEDAGLTIGTAPHRAAMELYNFCRAASSAYGDLTVIYKPERGGVSPDVIDRMRTLYPALVTEKYSGVTELSHIYSEAMMKRRFTSFSPSLSAAVREILAETEEGRRILEAENVAVSVPYENISDEEAKNIFGGNLSLSQSRLESFVTCRFGFYCKYVLSLSEKKKAELSYADIGNFVHSVLEKIFREGFLLTEDTELRRLVDEAIGDYLSAVIPEEEKGNTRIRSLFRRLRRGVLLFLNSFRKEFRNSKFTPVLFEMPIGIGNSSIPAEKIPLGDGTFAVLRGIADRVDSYRDGEGTVWVRVIDYKTGKKTFSPDDILKGHNLQLPLYLYSIVNSEDPDLLYRLGGKEGDVIRPAGFLYVNVSTKDEKTDDKDSASDERKLPKSGLFLRDEEILRAQDPLLAGDYIPVKMKNDGTLYADSIKNTIPEEGFYELYNNLIGTVGRIVSEMRSGDASATPDRNDPPCKYCGMKAFCRSAVRN